MERTFTLSRIFLKLAFIPLIFLLSKINVYPNPAANFINLEMAPDLKVSAYHIKIVNSFGTAVKESLSQHYYRSANISNLKPGSYFAQITNNNDQSIIGITTS